MRRCCRQRTAHRHAHAQLSSLKITSCDSLKALNASDNRISSLRRLNAPNLLALVLKSNPIAKLAHLHRLVALQTLVVSHCRLESLDGIEQCCALVKISASHNAIDSAGLRALTANHTALRELRLNDNRIGQLPDVLAQLPLEIVDVGKNQLFQAQLSGRPAACRC